MTIEGDNWMGKVYSNNWRYVVVAVLLIAVIDHGSDAVGSPSVRNVIMTVIYMVGLIGGILFIWHARGEGKPK